MRVRAYYKIASTPVKANPFSVHFGWWIETPCSNSPVVVKPHFITKHDKLKMEIKNTKKKKKKVLMSGSNQPRGFITAGRFEQGVQICIVKLIQTTQAQSSLYQVATFGEQWGDC